MDGNNRSILSCVIAATKSRSRDDREISIHQASDVYRIANCEKGPSTPFSPSTKAELFHNKQRHGVFEDIRFFYGQFKRPLSRNVTLESREKAKERLRRLLLFVNKLINTEAVFFTSKLESDDLESVETAAFILSFIGRDKEGKDYLELVFEKISNSPEDKSRVLTNALRYVWHSPFSDNPNLNKV